MSIHAHSQALPGDTMSPTPDAPHAIPDMQRFSLRRFLESLGPDEIERRGGPTDLSTIGQILEGNPKAVLFSEPGGEAIPLAGNVAGSRARLAHAFGTTPDKLLAEVLARLRHEGQLVDVPRDAAAVQEVVQVGDECDLTALPVHLQHGLD